MRFLLDTNILLLFLVGNKFPETKWPKRLKSFDKDDLNLVNKLCAQYRHITLPNILTETSNLLDSGKKEIVPGASDLLARYAGLASEYYLPSAEVVLHPEYPGLGLTDAAIIQLADSDVTVLTVDDELWGRLTASGAKDINIRHAKTRY